MKRIILLMLVAATTSAFAQKAVKPNINKALGFWKDGKLAEAKEMIDAATTYEKTMNDGETWYYRGLIYASIDTTTNEQYKALDPNALSVAMESFKKADQLGKAGKEYFVQTGAAVMPTTKTQQMEILANYYLDKGIKKFQDEQDTDASLDYLKKTRTVFETALPTYANDTLTYYVEGLVASQAEKNDIAIDAVNKYLAKGGKSKDAFLILYQIYNGQGDKEKALEAIRAGRAKLPNNPDFPKMEIGLLIDMNKIQEAQTNLEDAVKKEPDNKVLQFYLGYVYSKIDNVEGARKCFQEALRIDPAYYDAQFYLANTYLLAVDKTSKTLSNTGNTPADSKKRTELVQQRVKESEIALPYLEKVEKMKAPDKDSEIDVLHKLALLYYYVADDKNAARVDKKLKALGETD